MNQIEIPETLKPDAETTLGLSGGMHIHLDNWEAVEVFFEPTNVAFFAYCTVHYSKHVN
jgi:hypothetical protein